MCHWLLLELFIVAHFSLLNQIKSSHLFADTNNYHTITQNGTFNKILLIVCWLSQDQQPLMWRQMFGISARRYTPYL